VHQPGLGLVVVDVESDRVEHAVPTDHLEREVLVTVDGQLITELDDELERLVRCPGSLERSSMGIAKIAV